MGVVLPPGRRLLALALVACSRAPATPDAAPIIAAAPAPAAPGANPGGVAFMNVIMFTPKPAVDLETALTRCARAAGPLVRARMADTARFGVARYEALLDTKTRPPDEESLRYFARGVSAAAVAALQKSEEAYVIGYAGPPARALATLRLGAAHSACLAHETGGLIWSVDSRQLFTEETWRPRVERWTGDVPVAADHIAVHSYVNEGLVRSVTLGMGQLGLPDLVVTDHPQSLGDSMVSLINHTAQALVEKGSRDPTGELQIDLGKLTPPSEREEGAAIRKEGGLPITTVQLVETTREEGDAENRLLEITFPGLGAPQERQMKAIARFFGGGESAQAARGGDAELEAVAVEARRRLRELRVAFKDRIPEMTQLVVKAPFATRDGGVEWMWVEVTRWKGKSVEGILVNEPDLVALTIGAHVTVAEDQLADYLLRGRDGKVEGGESGRILQGRRAR